MKEYIGKGYACKLSPEEADHLSEKGGSKHNCWPITIGDTGLKSTYQLCRRNPSGNRKKGTFMSETSVARNQWALGRVENLFPGADGLMRTVEVRAKGAILKLK